MDSLAFLESFGGPRFKTRPVYVLHGDEDFLKRQVIVALRGAVFGEGDGEFGLSSHPGDKATFAAVADELGTVPFLGSRRLVIVENADPFVTRHRAALEKYVAGPSATGVLVLEVRSWPANTRLAKLVEAAATIVCKAPAAFRLPEWCVRWCQSHHGKELTAQAARLLVDLVGPEMGLLDQEMTKLVIYVGPSPRIDARDVDRLVGSSRAEDTFKIFDALGEGRLGDAMRILDRLFDQGEEPLKILGAFSYQLRRLAQAARLNRQGVPMAAALDQVGIPPFARQKVEQQLRQLSRGRTDRLYDWLLEADLGLKGGSQLGGRTLLERFLVRLGRDSP